MSRPPSLLHRGAPPRGVAIQGCLILVASMALVTTFAMYNADKVLFHAGVALLASVGCGWMTYRDRVAEAAAFASIALPGLVSAALGYRGTWVGDDLKGLSAWLYIAGCVLYVVQMVRVGLRQEGPGAPDDAPPSPAPKQKL